MQYAIIELVGHQYRVEPGQTLKVPGLMSEVGSEIKVEKVLLERNEKVTVGTPYVKSAIKLKVLEKVKGDKLHVATYKSKSRYRKAKGYRDILSVVNVLK